MTEVTTIRDEILTFAEGYLYFSINELKEYLQSENISYSDNTIKQYLSKLQKAGRLYNAGLGWYSTIEKEFRLDTDSVAQFVNDVTEQFPFLDFSAWSTKQVRGYFHHLPGIHYTFLYLDQDSLNDVYSVLVNEFQNIYLDPTPSESRKFVNASEEAFICRPAISEEPRNGKFATIEKLLTDLFLEKDRLAILDETEYDAIFQNVINAGRINIPKLLRYARRRKVPAIKSKLDILAAH